MAAQPAGEEGEKAEKGEKDEGEKVEKKDSSEEGGGEDKPKPIPAKPSPPKGKVRPPSVSYCIIIFFYFSMLCFARIFLGRPLCLLYRCTLVFLCLIPFRARTWPTRRSRCSTRSRRAEGSKRPPQRSSPFLPFRHFLLFAFIHLLCSRARTWPRTR